MFDRLIINDLQLWSKKKNRKPLVLQGARQTGKTSVVRLFAKRFEHFVSVNLDIPKNKAVFERAQTTKELVDSLMFNAGIDLKGSDRILLFIDEIQESYHAVKWLRYFYEEYPDLYVIAAGSLLQKLLDEKVHFPVGRVEYLQIHSVSFIEYLNAKGLAQKVDTLNELPFPSYAYDTLRDEFKTYSQIGGMPEIIKNYVVAETVSGISSYYDALLQAYLSDVDKYAPTNTSARIIKHCLKHAFESSGDRIKFEGFGNSNYKSREVGESLRTLEDVHLLSLIYPINRFNLPLKRNYRQRPKLFVHDVGLMNHFAGIQSELFHAQNLSDLYRGNFAEQIVYQEMKAYQYNPLYSLHFWVRQKKGSQAEVDLILPYDGELIPVEIKSGAKGRLKSLIYFMDFVDHDISIRIYDGPLKVDTLVSMQGKSFRLLNLPLFLTCRMMQYIEWMQK